MDRRAIPDLDFSAFRKEFPILFGGHMADEPALGQGWVYLMWDLCVALEAIARQRVEEGHPPMRIVQVKEKWAGLRCYMEHATPEAVDLARAASIRSETICEACGKPAYPNPIGNWYKALCPFHELEAKRIKDLNR